MKGLVLQVINHIPNPMPAKLTVTIRLGRLSLSEMYPPTWMDGITIQVTMLTNEAAAATVKPVEVRKFGAKLGIAKNPALNSAQTSLAMSTRKISWCENLTFIDSA